METKVKATSVIQLAQLYITNKDESKLSDILKRISINKMTTEKADQLLIIFLGYALKVKNSAGANQIIQYFMDADPTEGEDKTLPLFSRLFTMLSISDELLQFIAYSKDDITLVEVIESFIMHDDNDTSALATDRAIQIYNNRLNYQECKVLLDVAIDEKNYSLMELLTEKLEKLTPYALIPEWVYDFRGDTPVKVDWEAKVSLPNEQEILTTLPDISEHGSLVLDEATIDSSVDSLVEGLMKAGIDFKDVKQAKEVMKRQIETSSVEQKAELLEPVMENKRKLDLIDDKHIIRVLGPVNPLVGEDYNSVYDPEHICFKYGGCRMMTCLHFEGIDNDTEEEYDADWFRGSCVECHLRIRSRAHAVRRPLPHGGWIGCFDKWECVIKNMTMAQDLVPALILVADDQLKSIGLQDRVEIEEEEQEEE